MREGSKVLAVGALVACGWAVMRFDACARRSGSSPVPDTVASVPRLLGSNSPSSLPTKLARAVVRQDDFGAAWPFTVPDGVLTCVGHGKRHAIIFEAGGIRYGVNGTAQGAGTAAKLNLQNVRQIWRDDPEIPGAKVNMGPILERGRALGCVGEMP